MLLKDRQAKAVLRMFVNTFAVTDTEKRKELYGEFADSFLDGIARWERSIQEAFADEGIPEEIVDQWKRLEEERKSSKAADACEIIPMTLADEHQIVKLLSKELGCIPRYAELFDRGTVKDFEAAGFSFTAKKNRDVVGVIMAQRIMDYGADYIYVHTFAVEESMQGKGIGRKLMEQLISAAKQNRVYSIMLHTKKNRKAYDIYHHMGFEDQSEESVYMTKWFI